MAHNKPRLFITQLGSTAVIEAVWFGVPMLGIQGFSADQHDTRELP